MTQIPVSFNITEAAVHDVNAMDWINYEPFACYIFDRGYWDLDRLYRIEMLNSFFVIREKRTFTYYTNNFFLKAKDIAFLYKNRWAVETFFKWMKGHLRIKSFWGNTENAVRIQIYVAIVTYCTVAIIERTLELNRSIYEVMRILGSSLLTKDNNRDLFQPVEVEQTQDDGQLQLEFDAR
ncbi:MAG TPA: transposase [Paludibacter sp.]